MAVPTYIPSLEGIVLVLEGSLFSRPSSAFIVCKFFYNGHSDQCEVIYLCAVLICISLAAWAQEGLEELSHIEGQEGQQ